MTKIHLDPRNARHHTDENKRLVRQSLEEVGPFRSIAVDGDGIIRAGNLTYETAEALGIKVRVVDAAPDELIAVRRADLTGAEMCYTIRNVTSGGLQQMEVSKCRKTFQAKAEQRVSGSRWT